MGYFTIYYFKDSVLVVIENFYYILFHRNRAHIILDFPKFASITFQTMRMVLFLLLCFFFVIPLFKFILGNFWNNHKFCYQ